MPWASTAHRLAIWATLTFSPLLHCAEMKNLQKDDDPFRTYTRKWQEGELSNYDYLMLLNHRSGNLVR
jgi:hypothetical protein